jgi:RNA polymerase sigma factor (sigma-70 family)
MSQRHLRQLDLSEIAEGCQRESDRFRAGQPGEEGHCFELFRRAIEEDDQDAWSAIYAQYRQLVAKWLGGHRASDELIETAFEKFWRTLRSVRLSRRFKHVGAVLAYLRKCAVSVRLDLERKEQREDRIVLNERIVARAGDVEDLALDNLSHTALCATVQRWLTENVQEEQERQMVHLSYELDLSPSEIARRFPGQFTDVQEVHRVKERLLKRLRRVSELQELFER